MGIAIRSNAVPRFEAIFDPTAAATVVARPLRAVACERY
jgi:hypothetical protein